MVTPQPSGIDRRGLLAALGIGLPALAIRPAWAAADPMPLTAILERSRLGALTGFAVSDASTGQVLEAHQPDVDQPPASVVKILTALWALEVLGPGYRFPTQLIATGPVEGGVVRGDLVLAGSGDPVFDTDALGDMAAALRTAGVTGVAGRFVVAGGALPGLAEIEPGQPVDASYNPAISGMNLNFNRVFLAWGPGGGAARMALSAPGLRHDAPVAGIRAEVRPGGGPLGHRFDGGAEVWAVAPEAVSGRGSRWLPVRRPADYAGEVFRALARARGIRLPAPEVAAGVPGGTVLARHDSPAFDAMMRDMLFHSTNLTAEVAGLRAAQAGGAAPRGLTDSAAAMTAWARSRYGLRRPSFVNHSGLTDRSRMSPSELLRVLERARPRAAPARAAAGGRPGRAGGGSAGAADGQDRDDVLHPRPRGVSGGGGRKAPRLRDPRRRSARARPARARRCGAQGRAGLDGAGPAAGSGAAAPLGGTAPVTVAGCW
jgi:D-alanyl-D-alanine carboxypeptidase/D-alanyl-D-alanine-endopeptidase (penicillin-binding protein 4)